VPKDKIADIPMFLADMLSSSEKGIKKEGAWFAKLKPFFDKKFGSGWRKEHKEFWQDFDDTYHVSKEDVEKLM